MKDLTDVNYYIDQEIDLVSIGHYNGNELSSWHGSQVLLPFLGTLLNEMGTDLESSQDKIVIFSSPIFYNYGNSMPYFKNYKLFLY